MSGVQPSRVSKSLVFKSQKVPHMLSSSPHVFSSCVRALGFPVLILKSVSTKMYTGMNPTPSCCDSTAQHGSFSSCLGFDCAVLCIDSSPIVSQAASCRDLVASVASVRRSLLVVTRGAAGFFRSTRMIFTVREQFLDLPMVDKELCTLFSWQRLQMGSSGH
jgi:hypothetical protein